MKRLALVLIAVLGLVGCHGSVQASHDWWYLGSQFCGDNTAGITLYSPDPGASWMSGTTGKFYVGNNCANTASAPQYTIQVAVSLYRSTGLCWGGVGWVGNPDAGAYAGVQTGFGTHVCNDGYYYSHADSKIYIESQGSWVFDQNGLNSPTDYYCNHNPCQG